MLTADRAAPLRRVASLLGLLGLLDPAEPAVLVGDGRGSR